MTDPFRAGYHEGQRSPRATIIPACLRAGGDRMRWIAGYLLGAKSPRPQIEPQVAKVLTYRQEPTP